jgi:hypothetical protein
MRAWLAVLQPPDAQEMAFEIDPVPCLARGVSHQPTRRREGWVQWFKHCVRRTIGAADAIPEDDDSFQFSSSLAHAIEPGRASGERDLDCEPR